MITEKEIEQAAKERSIYALAVNGFISGANFVLKDMDSEMCLFAEWVAINYVPIVASKELKYWQKGTYQNKEKLYSTSELLQIYKNRAITSPPANQ